MLDFRVGESSQSWTLVHHAQASTGQGPPKDTYRSFREALGVAVTSLTAHRRQDRRRYWIRRKPLGPGMVRTPIRGLN